MPESTTAEPTSDTRPTAEVRPSAPVAASGPTVAGLTRDQMQQRFGNRGTGQALQEVSNGSGGDGAPESAEQAGAEADSEGDTAAEADVAGPSPYEATAPARQGVTRAASESVEHPEPSEPVQAAQEAAVDADQEQARAAAEQTVTQIDAVPEGEVPPAEQRTFEDELREALEKAIPIPESEGEAERVMDQGGGQASAALSGAVDGMTEGAAGPLADASSVEAEVAPEDMPAPTEHELTVESAGEAPGSVSGASVVPPPLPDSQLDYSDHSADSDQAMAENDVTTEQLARGNETEFNEALGARDEAEAHATEGAAAFREHEAGARTDARGRADDAIGSGLTGFHSTRIDEIGSVAGTQESTSTRDEAKRLEITNRVVAIKDRTRADVERILNEMSDGATRIFKDGLEAAEKAYKKYFDDNVGGVSFFGLFRIGGDTERAFKAARGAYKAEVDTAIRAVVALVETKLAEAKRRVQEGKHEVDDYVAGLDEDLIQFGREARESVAGDFESLEGDIESAKSGLIDSLVDQYRESQERVAAMEEQLRQENMSLWDRIYEATVGLVQKILEFKNLLLSVLARAGEVIGAIIDDPIGFLGNLIAGIMGGLNRFKDNIVEHLKAGLMGWLVGSLQGAGIELPTTFDLKGILQLIFGILGVTYQFIRRKAVRLLGEETVSRLEQVAEIFVVLVREGPAGVWRLFMEKLGDVKEMILGEIREFVITKIILAGISWLIGLLNPASAFFKACKAIYDIVMFFINRGQQIMELVNAILDSIATIVAGNVAAMSDAVEKVLARILPVAISFLASLLGLGGISDKIRDIVGKIQAKVEEAIEWLVAKAVTLARKAGSLFGGGTGKQSDRGEDPATDDPEKQLKVDAAMTAIRAYGQQEGGDATYEEAVEIAARVKREHPVLSSLEVEETDESWNFLYRASSERLGASIGKEDISDYRKLKPFLQEIHELRQSIQDWARSREESGRPKLDVQPWIRKLNDAERPLVRRVQNRENAILTEDQQVGYVNDVNGVRAEYRRARQLEDRGEVVDTVSMPYRRDDATTSDIDIVSTEPASGVRRFVEVKDKALFTTGSDKWDDIKNQTLLHMTFVRREIAAGRVVDPIMEIHFPQGVHPDVKEFFESQAGGGLRVEVTGEVRRREE